MTDPYASPPSQSPLQPAEEKQYALLTHLLSIFFGFIPALIFFVAYRERGPFVRQHVVTEWNLQLTALVAQAIGFAIALIGWVNVYATTIDAPSPSPGFPPGLIVFFIGYVLIGAVTLVRAIFGIIASVAAHRGRFYRYPVAIRFAREQPRSTDAA